MSLSDRWNAAEKEIAKWGIETSNTGMYQCCEVDEINDDGSPNENTIIDRMNICAICVVEGGTLEVSDLVKPTTYDGDCDDCGRVPMIIDPEDWEDFE